MAPTGFSREKRKFIENHPLGASLTDPNIAAALLCCKGIELAEIKDNPKKKKEVIFVLKGDKELIAKRRLQFFKGRIDGTKEDMGREGMAVVAQFSQKARELMMAIKNNIRGELTEEDLAMLERMAKSEGQDG